MKKILMTVALALCSVIAMAQVTLFEGNLAEGIKKAKSENKKVMIVGSATWCSPCKYLTDVVFTTPEASVYINENFVVIKYYLDKADPDKIENTYGIGAYPTVVILGTEGIELTRIVGIGEDPIAYRDRIIKMLAPGATSVERKALFEADNTTMKEYIRFLTEEVSQPELANKVLMNFATNSPIEVAFSKHWVKYYRGMIESPKSPILKVLLDKSKEVVQVMGQQEYNDFIRTIGDGFILGPVMAMKVGKKDLSEALEYVQKNPLMSTDFSKFVAANFDIVVGKKSAEVIKQARKAFPKMDKHSKMNVMNVLSMFSGSRKEFEMVKPQLIELYEYAAKLEKNPADKVPFTNWADKLKSLK